MPPIYETENDRAIARVLIGQMCKSFGLYSVEMPLLHPWDFEIGFLPTVVALVEVKARKISFDTFPHIWLSVRKADRVVSDARRRKVNFIFLSAFADKPRFARIDTLAEPFPYRVETGGRKDRPDDDTAIEPCYCIPVGDFVPFTLREHIPLLDDPFR